MAIAVIWADKSANNRFRCFGVGKLTQSRDAISL